MRLVRRERRFGPVQHTPRAEAHARDPGACHCAASRRSPAAPPGSPSRCLRSRKRRPRGRRARCGQAPSGVVATAASAPGRAGLGRRAFDRRGAPAMKRRDGGRRPRPAKRRAPPYRRLGHDGTGPPRRRRRPPSRIRVQGRASSSRHPRRVMLAAAGADNRGAGVDGGQPSSRAKPTRPPTRRQAPRARRRSGWGPASAAAVRSLVASTRRRCEDGRRLPHVQRHCRRRRSRRRRSADVAHTARGRRASRQARWPTSRPDNAAIDRALFYCPGSGLRHAIPRVANHVTRTAARRKVSIVTGGSRGIGRATAARSSGPGRKSSSPAGPGRLDRGRLPG